MSNNTFWNEKINFGGGLSISRFMAAPLDGITDSPLRQLIREFSPEELLFTEMRHVACVSNEKEGKTLIYKPIEHPLAFQFSANRLDFIEQSVEKVINHGFVAINLNCGCPAPTVTRSGSGSALMANLPQLKVLINHFIKVINGRVPFSIKIRAGFKERNAVDVAKLAQDCGVEALIIHPRTQPEGFASRLDYDLVKRVKEAISIPVVFSGNLNRFETVQRVHEMTGVDGFMIGRALWGAPWKMKEITETANNRSFSIDTATALRYTLKHLNLSVQHYGPRGFTGFKKQLPQYIRTVAQAAEWRGKLLRSQTEIEMRELLDMIIAENGGAVAAVIPQ